MITSISLIPMTQSIIPQITPLELSKNHAIAIKNHLRRRACLQDRSRGRRKLRPPRGSRQHRASCLLLARTTMSRSIDVGAATDRQNSLTARRSMVTMPAWARLGKNQLSGSWVVSRQAKAPLRLSLPSWAAKLLMPTRSPTSCSKKNL